MGVKNQIYCCGSPQLWKSYQGVAELKRLRTAGLVESGQANLKSSVFSREWNRPIAEESAKG